ncbi:hypothetical protein GCM10027047_06670 [Rhodococcus aerolatus]
MPAVVVAHAVVQALLVVGDPVPATAPAFLGRLAASVVAVAVAGWLLARRVRPGARAARPSPHALVGWLVAVVLVAAAAVVHPLVGALAVVVALPLLTGAGRSLRRHPGRTVVAVVLTVAALVLTWVVSLLLGLFVTGVLGAGATWLWTGLVAALLLRRWSALGTR